MEINDVANFLRFVPIFHDLPSDQLDGLVQAAQIRDCAENELVAGPGQGDAELFVVVQGEFRVFLAHGSDGWEKEHMRLLPGDYHGVVSLFTGRNAQMGVRALTSGKLVTLSGDAVNGLLATSPEFAKAMCRALAYRVELSTEKVAAVPFVELSSYPHLARTVDIIPARICRVCQCLAVERKEDVVTVAMVNPGDVRARAFLVDVLRQHYLEFVAIAEDDFSQHATKLLGAVPELARSDAPFESLVCLNPSGQIVEMAATDQADILTAALTAAIRTGASDAHFEPGSGDSRIRLRIDGKMMTIRDDVPTARMLQIVSRIKVMSDLDITNARRPQDGRFYLHADDHRVEFRVSSMPCNGGEKVVLRIVNPNPDFERLGNLILSEPALRFAEDIAASPSGLILVTGPTGAGKTTTLYALLHMLNSVDHTRNVVTIEDPIEHNLEFATQVQVNKAIGLDFSTMLRSVLRQDPDVILVGEIRDHESASMALEAASTGHLVLSSLHTNSTLETLVRLRNLGVKPYLLADALRGVVSQRLAPRLCPGCTEPVPWDDPVIDRLKQMGVLPHDWSHQPQRGVNRDDCPPDGEKGLVGLFEILYITDRLRDMIEAGARTSDIEHALGPESQLSLADYSRFLLKEGLVSPYRIEKAFPRIPTGHMD